MKFETWNPSQNQDYVTSDHITKKEFSSLRSNLFIAEVVGSFPWLERLRDLEILYNKTSKRGFFSVSPWHPWEAKLESEINKEFLGVSHFDGEMCGHFDASSQIGKLLQIRESIGGADSGEWRIGGCLSAPANLCDGAVKKDLSFFLESADHLGFLLDLSEMQQSLLIAKPYEGIEVDIHRLLRATDLEETLNNQVPVD